MSKTAGSATSGFQTSSAASGVRPAPAGRTFAGPARIEPEERVSQKESRRPGDDDRPSSAPEPDDRPSAPGPKDDVSRDERRPDSGPGDDDSEADQGDDGDSAKDDHAAGGSVDGETREPRASESHAASESSEARTSEPDGDEDPAADRDHHAGSGPVIVESVHSAYPDYDFVDGSPSAGDSQPSWSRVIATTLRLWLQRRVLGGHDGSGERRRAMWRRAGVFGVVIVVFAAGALTIAIAQGRISSGPQVSRTGANKPRTAKPPGTSPLAQAAANRQKAAAWVTAQVGTSVIVSCDPLMCAELQASGFPVGNLMPLGVSATDPMGSQIVMSTTALRSQFGKRLPDVYAPVVVASFGSGAARVDVRVDAPQGTQAYLVAQRADFLAREAAGKQLLRNKFLHVTGVSRQDIASGHVDSRLLITLAALTGQQHQVYVSRFGDGGPDQVSAPLRMVRIAALIPRQQGKPHTYLTAVLRFLRTEQAPFRAHATVLHLATKTLVQIQFAAPSPLGLLGAKATP